MPGRSWPSAFTRFSSGTRRRRSGTAWRMPGPPCWSKPCPRWEPENPPNRATRVAGHLLQAVAQRGRRDRLEPARRGHCPRLPRPDPVARAANRSGKDDRSDFWHLNRYPNVRLFRPAAFTLATALATGEPVVAVATGDGALAIQELQLPGKRALRVADFVRGQPDSSDRNLVSKSNR